MEPERLPETPGKTSAGGRIAVLAVTLALFGAYASLFMVSARSYRLLSGLGADFSGTLHGLLAMRLESAGRPTGRLPAEVDEAVAGSAVARFSALSSLFWFRKASEPSQELTDAWARWNEARGSAASDLAAAGFEDALLDAVAELESISLRVHQSLETALLLFGLALCLGTAGSVAYYGRMRESELRARHAGDALRLGMRAEEDTRKAVAMELHDDVAQDIAAARMLCERAACEPSAGLAARAAETLAGVNRKIRSLSADLSPPELDRFGLAGALGGLCTDTARKTGCELDWLCPDSLPRLPRETELNVYRVVREAVANSVKHSRDGKARVSARVPEGGGLEIEVRDAGHDLPSGGSPHHGSAAGARGSGFGMRAMAERAEMAGAELEVDLRPGGSLVRIRLARCAEDRPATVPGSGKPGSGEGT